MLTLVVNLGGDSIDMIILLTLVVNLGGDSIDMIVLRFHW